MATCKFCGEPELLEIFEIWGHEFQFETCCPARHDMVCAEMADDPEFATELLREKQVEALSGGALRRVAYTDYGFGQVLLDWMPRVEPMGRPAAMDFITRWHAHNGRLPGDKFRAGVWNGDTLLGVVVVGFPTAQAYMPAFQRKELIEVRRLCVRRDLPRELTWKAASTLYRWAAERAREAGYAKIITYTLRDEESGMSLRYARWRPEAESKGGTWDRPSRPRAQNASTAPKIRWAKVLSKSGVELGATQAPALRVAA